MKTTTDYWFTIEPYVYINIVNKFALLYNTLDGVTIESDKPIVISLLQEILKEENYGTVLLKNEYYKQKDIYTFISELREKYMGDIIDISLSKDKPIQILPYVDFYNKRNKKYNFSSFGDILHTLTDINIHLGPICNISKLISFLAILPDSVTYNIIGNHEKITSNNELSSFLEHYPSQKNIFYSYRNIISLKSILINGYLYKILIDFPIDIQDWNKSIQVLISQAVSFEYIFNVTSLENCQQAEQLARQYNIEKYVLNPVYTGNNLLFFKEYVFLTKKDILLTSLSMKDFFCKQIINMHDFGKLNILPNGDVYANMSHPKVGNIFSDNIYEIIEKEIKEGKSWLRIRNQPPCTKCIYQWLCPSPSDYEIAIGRPNLCNIEP